MIKQKTLLVIICLLYAIASFAQDNYLNFRHMSKTVGLSHNQIRCIMKDSRGFMWFGTMNGLSRYDGYNFKVFKHNPDDSTSLIDNSITNFFEDNKKRIWITTTSGICVFNPDDETFDPAYRVHDLPFPAQSINNIIQDDTGNIWYLSDNNYGLFKYDAQQDKIVETKHDSTRENSIHSKDISAMAFDSSNDLWIIHRTGVIEKLNKNSLKVEYRISLPSKVAEKEHSYMLYVDNDGDIWVYPNDDAMGVFYLNVANKSILHINKDSDKFKLNNNIVTSLVQDNKGYIWIGTDHGGINLLDKNGFGIQYVLNDPYNENSLADNSVKYIYKDNIGIIWVGTFKKGVNFYHENFFKFKLFKNNPSNPKSLPFDDINCFEEDGNGNIWIGTNGGGLVYFDRLNNDFSQSVNNPQDNASLSNNIIVSMLVDHSKNLWVGTYYGGLDYFDGKKFIHYKHDPNNLGSLSDNRVWEIFEDSHNNLWIGTLGGGLELFNKEKNAFYHYRSGDFNSVSSDFILSITETKDGDLYIGTSYGLNILDRQTGRFVRYFNESDNPGSLSNNVVFEIIEDSRGLIWIATQDGLNLFNPMDKSFQVFKRSHGLPENSILSMVEDNMGSIWLGTNNGLSNLVVHTDSVTGDYAFRFYNYDESDGLQGMDFNEDAIFKTKNGELLIGGPDGFNLFYPNEIEIFDYEPELVFTNFQIFNENIEINRKINGRILFEKSFTKIDEIALKYHENVFSIEFAALNLFQPKKVQYQYMLEGFNSEWLEADGNSRKATYTNLDPGEYNFMVKVSKNDGIWSKSSKSLKIIIMPPLWRTKTAIAVYVVLIVFTLVMLWLLILKRERKKYQAKHEKQEAERRHELDMMKIKFFTNISHEFRTPLSLILTPLETILKNTKDEKQKKQFDIIQRNAKRLLHLVNQLLDFRKMEVQKHTLNLSRGDVVKFINDVYISFSDLSENKNIKFTYQSKIDNLYANFDFDKIEKILFNLLSNAFKFTPDNGFVKLELGYKEKTLQGSPEAIEIKVIDNGIGIPPEKHEKIFERFFQEKMPGKYVSQGSGIGLSLTSEFVKLHNGEIHLTSEPGIGSTFMIHLPINVDDIETIDNMVAESPTVEEDITDKQAGETASGKKALIMLVEDNEDFRFYLKDNLKDQFNVVEAGNGNEGWSKIIKSNPDLVVSDIMIPGMNGIELCQKIKNDQRTSHIPVILLTAVTGEEQRREGFETGADDYITKPFNFEIFELRIKNLISQRQSIRKRFQKQIEVKPSEISVTSLDEQFIKKAIDEVEKNLSNPEFSVTELSRALNMSRTTLYKKLLALTGKTPIEFIRVLRLKRAAQLLEESQYTISEIAFCVGFNDTRYFTKYFKAEFKVLPSVYASMNKKETKKTFKI